MDSVLQTFTKVPKKGISFKGPLFIIGMPRSGTKLIRDILNRHPNIGIPVIESHFIPYMIRKFGNPPNLSPEGEFDRFYREFSNTSFFWDAQALGNSLLKEDLQKQIDPSSWNSIFGTILRYYSPKKDSNDFIWGDKTPGYLNHMKLLKELYPQARFLHIIRDPRDYALSVKKTWGKSLYRAADTWRHSLQSAHSVGQEIGEDYQEVQYEELITKPEMLLPEICEFLDCEFTSAMLILDQPVENYGDTRGSQEIVSNNLEKYTHELNSTIVKRIEEIVFPIANLLGYTLHYASRYKPLNPIHLKILNLYDGYASVRFHIRERGVILGFMYFFHHHITSSWRADKNIT